MSPSRHPIPHLPFPFELREQIYTYLFQGLYLVFGPSDYDTRFSTKWTIPYDPSPLPILLASKQTNYEATAVLYKTASFLFRLPVYSAHQGYYSECEGPTFSQPVPQGDTQVQNVLFIVSLESSARFIGRFQPNNSENSDRNLKLFKGTNVLRNSMQMTFVGLSPALQIKDLHFQMQFDVQEMGGFREIRFEIQSDTWKDVIPYNKEGLEHRFGLAIVEKYDCGKWFLVLSPRKYRAQKLEGEATKLADEAKRLLWP